MVAKKQTLILDTQNIKRSDSEHTSMKNRFHKERQKKRKKEQGNYKTSRKE